MMLNNNFKSLFWLSVLMASLSACSSLPRQQDSKEVDDEMALDAEKTSEAEAVKIEHPQNFSMAALDKMFQKANVLPQSESLKTCDQDFRKALPLAKEKSKQLDLAKELIHLDPQHYHFCFYQQIKNLEESKIKNLEERQKMVIETYEFLAPIARAFLETYGDSRYLSWAVKEYQQINPVVFYRRVNESEELSASLAKKLGDEVNLRSPKEVDIDQLHEWGLMLDTKSDEAESSVTADSENPETVSTVELSEPTDEIPLAVPAPAAAPVLSVAPTTVITPTVERAPASVVATTPVSPSPAAPLTVVKPQPSVAPITQSVIQPVITDELPLDNFMLKPEDSE